MSEEREERKDGHAHAWEDNHIWEDNAAPSASSPSLPSFWVNRDCILCSVCSDAAPRNFRMSDWGDHDICYQQPRNEEEVGECWDALDNCPVEAIGCSQSS